MEKCYNFDKMVERNPYRLERDGIPFNDIAITIIATTCFELRAGLIDSYLYCGYTTNATIKHKKDCFYTLEKRFSYNGKKFKLPSENYSNVRELTHTLHKWIK